MKMKRGKSNAMFFLDNEQLQTETGSESGPQHVQSQKFLSRSHENLLSK